MKSLFGLTLLFSVIIIKTSKSQNWTGAVNSDWNNPANWSSNPTTGTAKIINTANYTGAAAQPVINTNSSFNPSTIEISNGATLTINANLTTTGNVNVLGSNSLLKINSGNVNIAINNNGRLVVDLGAKMEINGGTTTIGQRYIVGDGSETTMQGGTLTTNQRLILDLGGTFNFLAGTINVGQVLALADGNATNPSYFNMTGGTLNVTGEIALENEFGNYNPTLQIRNGTLNLNGDLVWFGETPGEGQPKFILDNATANISGNIQNLLQSTVNAFIKLTNNATLNFSGSLFELTEPQDSLLMDKSAKLYLNSAHTLTNNGVLMADSSTVYFNGTSTLSGTGFYQFYNVVINSNKSLVHNSPTIIFIKNDLTNNGNFTHGNNTIEFNGSNTQNISGSSALNFFNLCVNNSSVNHNGISLNNPQTTIWGELKLVSGKILTTNQNLLVIENVAISNSGNDTSFINGPAIKKGNQNFIFPLGKNNNWRRLEVKDIAAANTALKAEYFDESPSLTTPLNTPLIGVSNIEHWKLENLTGNDSINAAIYWEDAQLSGITNCNKTVMAKWNGNSWDKIESIITGTCANNGNGKITSNQKIYPNGLITFGFVGITYTQNLTICNGDSVQIGDSTYFTTGTYYNYFTTTQNEDSLVITNLTIITPPTNLTFTNGTLNAPPATGATYTWLDCNNNYSVINNQNSYTYTPQANGSYAVVASLNGCIDTSACYLVSTIGYNENTLNKVTIYPNPAKHQQIITIALPETIITNIEVSNALGQILINKNENEKRMVLSLEHLQSANGIYFIKIKDINNRVYYQKVIVTK